MTTYYKVESWQRPYLPLIEVETDDGGYLSLVTDDLVEGDLDGYEYLEDIDDETEFWVPVGSRG